MTKTVLILEDEVIVGTDLALTLEDEGFRCLGPATNVRTALGLIRAEPPDLAILDVNLRGETSRDVAESLEELDVPFLYITGYGEQGVMDEMPSAVILQKPIRFDRLLKTISELLG